MRLKLNSMAIIFASVLSGTVVTEAADMTKLTDKMEKHTINLLEPENTSGLIESYKSGEREFSRLCKNTNLSILTNSDYESILDQFELTEVLSLPKTVYSLLEMPKYMINSYLWGKKDIVFNEMYKIKHSDNQQDFGLTNWVWVDQGKASFKVKAPSKLIAVTHSISDCVGITITHPNNRIAISHMDILAYEDGLLGRLLEKFPNDIRKDCKVTLVSSFCTELLSGVYKTFIRSGFDRSKFTADIEPMFFDVKGKIGRQENRYMSELTWNKPLCDIRQLSRKEILSVTDEKLVMPKAILINLSTNQLYSFNKNGDNGYNDNRILEEIKGNLGRYYNPRS